VEPDAPTPKPGRAGRAPKPSQKLDPDARRLLVELLACTDIERLAALASQSESTIRRFAEGDTGARASVFDPFDGGRRARAARAPLAAPHARAAAEAGPRANRQPGTVKQTSNRAG
jgi:hypothetical protein